MIRKFVDRKPELEFLDKKYKENAFQCIVIYGRRRVGKTELIKEFISDKQGLYFLADKRGTAKNIERFVLDVQEHFNLPPLKIETFEEAFELIVERTKKRPFVVVVDEFSYLMERDRALGSVFQLIIDEILKKNRIFLILCGSSMSMMERGVLSYKSPLYGRRTGQIRLEPLNIHTLKEFFPKYTSEELIETYSILGGIPAYLIQFDQQKGVLDNIKETFFVKEHIFYEEPEMILKEELREPKVYFNIFEAMASGRTKLTDIANKAGINAKDSSSYLSSLQRLDMIEKVFPVTEKKPRSKKALYYIKDNFFIFWFRFILANKEKIEREEYDKLIGMIEDDLPRHVSRCFEKVCVEFLWSRRIFDYSRIERWWGVHREKEIGEREALEIDVVGISEDTREILFGECKWQTRKIKKNVAADLLSKTGHVKWYNEDRKEYYVLFSKSGFEKSCMDFCKANNILMFDLKDIEKQLWI